MLELDRQLTTLSTCDLSLYLIYLAFHNIPSYAPAPSWMAKRYLEASLKTINHISKQIVSLIKMLFVKVLMMGYKALFYSPSSARLFLFLGCAGTYSRMYGGTKLWLSLTSATIEGWMQLHQ